MIKRLIFAAIALSCLSMILTACAASEWEEISSFDVVAEHEFWIEADFYVYHGEKCDIDDPDDCWPDEEYWTEDATPRYYVVTKNSELYDSNTPDEYIAESIPGFYFVSDNDINISNRISFTLDLDFEGFVPRENLALYIMLGTRKIRFSDEALYGTLIEAKDSGKSIWVDQYGKIKLNKPEEKTAQN